MKLNKDQKQYWHKEKKGTALRKSIYPGAFIQYKYNPKYRDVLPFWDAFPSIIVMSKTKRHILGLNLHFVPVSMRKTLVGYLVKTNKSNIKKGLPMKADYDHFKGLLKKLNLGVAVRKYIISRMSSDMSVINSNADYLEALPYIQTKKLYGVESDNIYRYLVKKQKIKNTKKMTRKRRDLKYS